MSLLTWSHNYIKEFIPGPYLGEIFLVSCQVWKLEYISELRLLPCLGKNFQVSCQRIIAHPARVDIYIYIKVPAVCGKQRQYACCL